MLLPSWQAQFLALSAYPLGLVKNKGFGSAGRHWILPKEKTTNHPRSWSQGVDLHSRFEALIYFSRDIRLYSLLCWEGLGCRRWAIRAYPLPAVSLDRLCGATIPIAWSLGLRGT